MISAERIKRRCQSFDNCFIILLYQLKHIEKYTSFLEERNNKLLISNLFWSETFHLGGKLIKTQESLKVDPVRFISEQPTSLKKFLKFKKIYKVHPSWRSHSSENRWVEQTHQLAKLHAGHAAGSKILAFIGQHPCLKWFYWCTCLWVVPTSVSNTINAT